VDEMVDKVYYEKCISAIAHALDEVKIEIVVVDHVEVWFLLLIKKRCLYLNGEVILEATNIDHL
jgi:hypothetical protein